MPATSTKKSLRRIPRQYKPDDLSLDEWQIGLRRQDGPERAFTIENTGESPVYSDFLVKDSQSDVRYKVAIRSQDIGLNYCSCQDFRVSTLGTCEHIEFVWARLRRTRGLKKAITAGHTPSYSSLSLRYGMQREILLRIGPQERTKFTKLAAEFFDSAGALLPDSIDRIETFIERAHLDQDQRGVNGHEIRRVPAAKWGDGGEATTTGWPEK